MIANGPLDAQQPVTGGTRWRFAETEPISTYLAAFAAGPWTHWTSAPAGERPISLYARASRRAEVDAEAQIATNRAAVRWLSDWFGVPFPFAKLDLLLAPAFPFGGMEHVGAVFYNEDRFIFREPPTLPQRLGRDATIYHEISHQWFGDFVTMRWFDDLWLKEGFATYMAARIQAELQPTATPGPPSSCRPRRPPIAPMRPAARRRCGSRSTISMPPRAITARSSTTRRRRSSNSSPSWSVRRGSAAASTASWPTMPMATPPGRTCSARSARRRVST